MNRRDFVAASVASGAALTMPAFGADPWPTKPITLTVPFAAGGPTDALARALGKSLQEILKQPVVVDNRPGAGGSIGMNATAKAAPDGYTLGMGHTGTNSINPFLYAKLPYDPQRDLIPVTPIVSYTNVLVVNPSVPARTVAEFIAWAKANPQQATFASGGIGATNHLSGEILKSVTGAPLTHVSYKGNAPAMVDLIAGNVSCMFDILITALPQIQAGKVRPLAVTSRKRSNYLPQVPTMKEAGLGAFEQAGNDLWFGLFAPAKTPPEILEKLHAAVMTAMKTAELQKAIQGMYYEPWTLPASEFAEFLKHDRERWGRVVVSSGAKAE